LPIEAPILRDRRHLRRSLSLHHATTTELLVGLPKAGSGRRGMTYREALDEALSYGWIDGVRKNLDSTAYTIRFTPRRRGSVWSVANTRRVGELITLGRVKALRADRKASAFFEAQPPGYRKIAIFWIMNARRADTRARRLAHLIGRSRAGTRIDLLKPGGRR
jgi:uncharacterized protein YdeI (YjbR/CyaY-like superfamily)